MLQPSLPPCPLYSGSQEPSPIFLYQLSTLSQSPIQSGVLSFSFLNIFFTYTSNVIPCLDFPSENPHAPISPRDQTLVIRLELQVLLFSKPSCWTFRIHFYHSLPSVILSLTISIVKTQLFHLSSHVLASIHYYVLSTCYSMPLQTEDLFSRKYMF